MTTSKLKDYDSMIVLEKESDLLPPTIDVI